MWFDRTRIACIFLVLHRLVIRRVLSESTHPPSCSVLSVALIQDTFFPVHLSSEGFGLVSSSAVQSAYPDRAADLAARAYARVDWLGLRKDQTGVETGERTNAPTPMDARE